MLVLVRGDPAVGNVVATVAIEAQALWCHPYARLLPLRLYNSIACCNILVSSQRMGWSGVFGYGRLVHEAFDACVLMLLQTCFKPVCSLADVHLSAGAWHFVDNVLLGEGVLDLIVRRVQRMGPDLNTALMLKSLYTHPPDPLTNTSYVDVEISEFSTHQPRRNLGPPS